MKVGDLVRSTILDHWQEADAGILGVIVGAYDTPKGIWMVHWIDGSHVTNGTLCHENNMEVVNESG